MSKLQDQGKVKAGQGWAPADTCQRLIGRIRAEVCQARGFRAAETGLDVDGAWRRVARRPVTKFSGQLRFFIGYKIPVVSSPETPSTAGQSCWGLFGLVLEDDE